MRYVGMSHSGLGSLGTRSCHSSYSARLQSIIPPIRAARSNFPWKCSGDGHLSQECALAPRANPQGPGSGRPGTSQCIFSNSSPSLSKACHLLACRQLIDCKYNGALGQNEGGSRRIEVDYYSGLPHDRNDVSWHSRVCYPIERNHGVLIGIYRCSLSTLQANAYTNSLGPVLCARLQESDL